MIFFLFDNKNLSPLIGSLYTKYVFILAFVCRNMPCLWRTIFMFPYRILLYSSIVFATYASLLLLLHIFKKIVYQMYATFILTVSCNDSNVKHAISCFTAIWWNDIQKMSGCYYTLIFIPFFTVNSFSFNNAEGGYLFLCINS